MILEHILVELYDKLERSTSRCRSNSIALSGGLDSSVIAYLLRDQNPHAVAVIADDFIGSDLTYCQLASKHLGIKLNIEHVATDKILESIKETIRILGNFNDIEIRNSVVIYLAVQSVKQRGKTGLITGDGADELFAGYNFLLSKSVKDLEREQCRIWDVMHFPSHVIGKSLGVQIESPFLSDEIVQFAKSIDLEYKVREEDKTTYGKWILRKAFENKIPKKIAWRRKEPMQDGSGTCGLERLFDTVVSDEIFEEKRRNVKETDGVVIRTKESMYYYEIYRQIFGAPVKNNDESACPYCSYIVAENSKFCRLCGAYPV